MATAVLGKQERAGVRGSLLEVVPFRSLDRPKSAIVGSRRAREEADWLLAERDALTSARWPGAGARARSGSERRADSAFPQRGQPVGSCACLRGTAPPDRRWWRDHLHVARATMFVMFAADRGSCPRSAVSFGGRSPGGGGRIGSSRRTHWGPPDRCKTRRDYRRTRRVRRRERSRTRRRRHRRGCCR